MEVITIHDGITACDGVPECHALSDPRQTDIRFLALLREIQRRLTAPMTPRQEHVRLLQHALSQVSFKRPSSEPTVLPTDELVIYLQGASEIHGNTIELTIDQHTTLTIEVIEEELLLTLKTPWSALTAPTAFSIVVDDRVIDRSYTTERRKQQQYSCLLNYQQIKEETFKIQCTF